MPVFCTLLCHEGATVVRPAATGPDGNEGRPVVARGRASIRLVAYRLEDQLNPKHESGERQDHSIGHAASVCHHRDPCVRR